MPNGMFWTGKSPPGSFAEATHDRSSARCVSSITSEQAERREVVDRLAERARPERLDARAACGAEAGSRHAVTAPRDAVGVERQRRWIVLLEHCPRDRFVPPRAQQRGGEKDVEKAVHAPRRARRVVRQRVIAAEWMVESGRGLEPNTFGDAGREKTREVRTRWKRVGGGAAGANLRRGAGVADGVHERARVSRDRDL